MTAIKKTNKKTKTAAPAAKVKTVARKTSKPTKTATVAAVRKPAVQIVAAQPLLTAITAKIDVGFGNALYIRGEGPGLNWDKGVALDCVGADSWHWSAREASRPITFKLLVNDLTWSAGPDFTVAAGSTVTLTPEF
jgi:hypothetical protein